MLNEFMDLQIFCADCAILMNADFWKLLFVMCHALYTPMRVLHLADQKTPAIDKLYYYVLQTDQMLPKYLQDAKEHTTSSLTNVTISAMDRLSSAGILAACSEDAEEDEKNYDDMMDADDVFENEEMDSDDEQ
jgi:hypothetical protein